MPTPTTVPTLTSRLLLRALGAVALGAVIGAVGTVVHRSTRPWGLVLALLLVLVAAVTTRAWAGLLATVGLLVGLFVVIQVLSSAGPGGDVLVPASDGYGWTWVGGAMLLPVLTALAPRGWFADVPLRRATPAP